jgi:hypothetical protein
LERSREDLRETSKRGSSWAAGKEAREKRAGQEQSGKGNGRHFSVLAIEEILD